MKPWPTQRCMSGGEAITFKNKADVEGKCFGV